jgi:hypothetical protein
MNACMAAKLSALAMLNVWFLDHLASKAMANLDADPTRAILARAGRMLSGGFEVPRGKMSMFVVGSHWLAAICAAVRTDREGDDTRSRPVQCMTGQLGGFNNAAVSHSRLASQQFGIMR